MKILVINGSPRNESYSKVLAEFALEHAKTKSDTVKILDLSTAGVEPFVGEVEYSEKTKEALEHMENADSYIICTPVYNGFFSAAIKNLFEHLDYKSEKKRKAGFIIMAGGKISFLQVQTQLNSLMNYFTINSEAKAAHVNKDAFDDKMVLTSEDVKKRVKDVVDCVA